MTSKKFVESLAKIPLMPGDRERQVEQTYNDILKTDFNEFKELYKKLSEKLLPQVYELGFLKK